MAPSFASDALDDDGPTGLAQREQVAQALQVKDPEFHSLGLVLGYDYPDSPVVVSDSQSRPQPSVTKYVPSAHAGARLPHAWLPDNTSIYDHLSEAGLTLIRLTADADPSVLLEAAEELSVPLSLVDLSHVPELHARYEADLLLVRPDQHIAWRGKLVASPTSLLNHVRGADSSDAPAAAIPNEMAS